MTYIKRTLSYYIHRMHSKMTTSTSALFSYSFNKKKSLFFIVIFLQGCNIIGAGTTGNISSYDLDYSKAEVNLKIKEMMVEYPQYRVPELYSNYTWHFGGGRDTKDEWIQEANADSVSFNIYLPKEEIILWCGFSEFSKDWNKPGSTLYLIGYISPNLGTWQFENDMSGKEKERIKKLFDVYVLKKIM